MRRRSAFLRTSSALLVLVTLILSGFSPVRAQLARDNVTLQFWTPLIDPLGRSLLIPYLHKFEQSHPGITVNFVPVHADNNNWVKYTTAMAAGHGPDVVLTSLFNPPVPEWAANGLIQPLDTWFKQLHISQDKFLPWVWKMQYFHGHVWGFVQEYDTTVFLWNKDSFRKAGLDPNRPPRTIAELDADARKLTKLDAKGNLVQAGFVPWVWATGSTYDPGIWPVLFGGQIYDQEHRRFTLNNSAGVRSLAWMSTYAKMLGGADKVNGLEGKFSGNVDPFFDGHVAMEIGGDWIPLFSFNLYGPKNLHYGVANPPTAPGVPYGTNEVIGTDTFVMPAGTAHPKEAAELMLYMMGSAPVLAWCIGEANVPPTRAATFDPSYVKGVPYMAPAIQTARLAMTKPQVLVPFPSSSVYDYVLTQLGTAQQQVEFGRMSAQAALDEAQRLADQREAEAKTANPDWYAAGD